MAKYLLIVLLLFGCSPVEKAVPKYGMGEALLLAGFGELPVRVIKIHNYVGCIHPCTADYDVMFIHNGAVVEKVKEIDLFPIENWPHG